LSRVFSNKKVLLALLLIIGINSLIIGGCAYFNAFYNSKHYFQEAERERERTTDLNSTPDGYNKSIEAGGRLIEYYPESKYIEEALLIMGQCYYWTEDYFKAKRKFEELLSNYPQSENRKEARLWMGRTLVGMKNRHEATSTLRSLLADTDDPELTSGALFALAELYFLDSLFNKAEEEFLNITNSTEDEKILGEAYWRSGEAAFRGKRFSESAEHLKKALDHELTKTLRFQTTLFYGRALYEAGKYPEAKEVFQKLLKDKRYFKEHGKVRVHLALVESSLGNNETAFEELKNVIENHQRTVESARAYYERAILSLKVAGSRELAKEDLDKARVEKAGSEYAQKADTLLNTLNRVDELGLKRSKTLLRIEFTNSWLSEPIESSDTIAFFAASWYDSLALDSLQLASLWSQAWHDSFPPPPEPDTLIQMPDSLQQLDSLQINIPNDSIIFDEIEDSELQGEMFEKNDSSLFALIPPGGDHLLEDSLQMSIDESMVIRERERQYPDFEPIPQIGDSIQDVAMNDEEFEHPLPFDENQLEPHPAFANPDMMPLPGEDSLAEMSNIFPEPLFGAAGDSIEPDSLDQFAAEPEEEILSPEPIHIFDLTPVLDSLAFMKVELQDIRFKLGEIRLFDLDETDSAKVVFQELAVPPNVDSVRIKAILSLAYIAEADSNFGVMDSLIKVLAEEFSGTEAGIRAAITLGKEPPEKPVQADVLAFNEIEELYLSKEESMEELFTRYRWVAETYPNSPFAPKAMFASAYIAGANLDDGESVEEIFNIILERFPTSEQAVEAGNILSALQSSKNQEMQGEENELEPSEEELQAISEDEVEIKPMLIGGIETLSSILEMRNLLPQDIISGTGGEIQIRYIIYADGKAANFRVILEDPPGRGLSRALIAGLEEMSFTAGQVGDEFVDTRVIRTYTLPLDAPPNVRPLPRRYRG